MIKEEILSLIVELGINAAKSEYESIRDEKRLREHLADYIQRQRKYNDICSEAEYIDFEALATCIKTLEIKKVAVRAFAPDEEERGKARDYLVDSIMTKIGIDANDEDKREKVKKISYDVFDIIRNYYSDKTTIKDYVIISETTDAVAKEIRKALKDSKSEIFSVDNAISMIKDGKISDVEKSVNDLLHHISRTHPLAPDYRYGMEGDTIRSIPNSKEAIEKYPPRILITGKAFFNDEDASSLTNNPFDYSYRHQIPIRLEINNAIKLLGAEKDPRQHEVEGLLGSKAIIYPPRLSESIPCSIRVKTVTHYDLLYIQTLENPEDGTVVIGNMDDSDIIFKMHIDPKDIKHPRFTIKTKEKTNKAMLKLYRFLRDLDLNHDLQLYSLKDSTVLIGGIVDFQMHTDFNSIDEEIDLISRVCDIEEYFDITINPPSSLNERDISRIKYLSDLVKNDSIVSQWKELHFKFETTDEIRRLFSNWNGTMVNQYCIANDNYELLGVEIPIKYIRYIRSATIVDYDRQMEKLKHLDDGDIFNVTIASDSENSFIDSLVIPEEIVSRVSGDSSQTKN